MTGGIPQLPLELWREIVLASGSPLSLTSLTAVSKVMRASTLFVVYESLRISFQSS